MVVATADGAEGVEGTVLLGSEGALSFAAGAEAAAGVTLAGSAFAESPVGDETEEDDLLVSKSSIPIR